VTWGGLILVLLGAALLVADLHVTSHGALTLSGLVAMALGFIVLFNKAPAPYHTSETLIVTATVLIGTLWAFAISKALAIRRAPAAVGPEQIIGREGIARDDGYVLVQGELWRAQSDDPLAPGERVRVDALDGLTLDVHRIDA
jgi:membrane-bound serine protease (ClpP class)